MLKHLKKQQVTFFLISSLLLVAGFLFWPTHLKLLSMFMFLLSTGMAAIITYRKHQEAHRQAECTREKMIRNLILDLLGLLVTMGAAMYIGRFAGGYFGVHSGFWIGLLAGFAGGFLAAWVARSAWSRLVLARA